MKNRITSFRVEAAFLLLVGVFGCKHADGIIDNVDNDKDDVGGGGEMQSIAFVPQSSDGKVNLHYVEVNGLYVPMEMTLNFEVVPAEAADKLAASWQTSLRLVATYTDPNAASVEVYPQLWKSEMAKIEQNMKESGQYIDVFEVKNEPNISPGWTIEKNLQMIGEVAGIMRKYGIKGELAGPVPCGTDFTWIASVLAGENAKYLTVVTEHPYRALPELPDYADDVQTVRKII